MAMCTKNKGVILPGIPGSWRTIASYNSYHGPLGLVGLGVDINSLLTQHLVTKKFLEKALGLQMLHLFMKKRSHSNVTFLTLDVLEILT
jgi:hypothetical protein